MNILIKIGVRYEDTSRQGGEKVFFGGNGMCLVITSAETPIGQETFTSLERLQV